MLGENARRPWYSYALDRPLARAPARRLTRLVRTRRETSSSGLHQITISAENSSVVVSNIALPHDSADGVQRLVICLSGTPSSHCRIRAKAGRHSFMMRGSGVT